MSCRSTVRTDGCSPYETVWWSWVRCRRRRQEGFGEGHPDDAGLAAHPHGRAVRCRHGEPRCLLTSPGVCWIPRSRRRTSRSRTHFRHTRERRRYRVSSKGDRRERRRSSVPQQGVANLDDQGHRTRGETNVDPQPHRAGRLPPEAALPEPATTATTSAVPAGPAQGSYWPGGAATRCCPAMPPRAPSNERTRRTAGWLSATSSHDVGRVRQPSAAPAPRPGPAAACARSWGLAPGQLARGAVSADGGE